MYWLALFMAVFAAGCATCPPVKPCPPPQTITIEVPVPAKIPSPPVVDPPQYLLPLLDLDKADTTVILSALYMDLEAARLYAEQLEQIVALYRDASCK